MRITRSLVAIGAQVEGAGPDRLPATPTGHTGVYRLAKVEGRMAKGRVAGMLFLREDRACVLRLVVPVGDDKLRVKVLRGIWWPVPVGIKTLTSDGSLGVWAVSKRSVTARFPLAAPGAAPSDEVTEVKFVRVR